MNGIKLFYRNNKEKITNTKLVLTCIYFVLLIIPQLWNDQGSYNIGGDDSRFYVYAPIEWIKHVSTSSWFEIAGIGTYNPQFFYLPINALALLFKIVFPFVNHMQLLYGFVLANVFLATFYLIQELLYQQTSKNKFWAAVVGSLLYVCLPLVYMMEWNHPTFRLYGIIAYPVLLLFFLLAIHRNNIRFLMIGAGCSAIFSVAIMSIPTLIPFAISFAVFFLLYFIFIEQHKFRFIRFVALYIFFIVVLNAFWMVPFAYSSLKGNAQVGGSLQTMSTITSAETEYYASRTNLVDHFSGISGFYFAASSNIVEKIVQIVFRDLHFNIVFIIFIIVGCIFAIKQLNGHYQKILAVLVITWLATTFLMTADIGSWGITLFTWCLQHVPGFYAIRNYWSKVAEVYGLFFAVAVGVAYYGILEVIKQKKISQWLTLSVVTVVIIQGVPLFTGTVVNLPIRYGSSGEKINRVVQLPDMYMESISYLQHPNTPIGRVLSLPLVKGSWTIIPGSDPQGVYIGASPIKILTGRDDFNSELSFGNLFLPNVQTMIVTAVEANNTELLSNIFSLLQITQVVFDSQLYDDHQYDFDAIRNDHLWIYPQAAGANRYRELLEKLPVEFEKNFDRWQIYTVQSTQQLSRVYIPQKLRFIQSGFESFSEYITVEDYDIHSGYFFQTADQNKLSIPNENISSFFVPVGVNLDDTYQISIPENGEYQILVKKTSALNTEGGITIAIDEQLVDQKSDSQASLESWINLGSVYLAAGMHTVRMSNELGAISIADPNDVILFFQRDVPASPAPNLQLTQISSTKFHVSIDHVTTSFPLVLLENFHPYWKIYSTSAPETNTWLKQPIFENNHMRINGYANGWWIDIEELKKIAVVQSNDDGSYNLNLIIEFWPQRIFYVGLGITGLAVIISSGYLGYFVVRHVRRQYFTQKNGKV